MSATATELARRLHREHCLSVPVNLAPILTNEGLAVVAFPFSAGIQELLCSPLSTIGVDSELPRREQRALAAHGLAHHFLHCGSHIHLDAIDPMLKQQQEHDADCFARCLLIPPNLLANRLSKGESVEELADLFDVPLVLVHEAIADLHQQPSYWTQTALWR